jgi:hypothetical protein
MLLTGWSADLSTSTNDLSNVGVNAVTDNLIEISVLIRAIAQVLLNCVEIEDMVPEALNPSENLVLHEILTFF